MVAILHSQIHLGFIQIYSVYMVRNLLEPVCSGKADTVVGIRLQDRHNHGFRNPRKFWNTNC